jgi:hypothetical protein
LRDRLVQSRQQHADAIGKSRGNYRNRGRRRVGKDRAGGKSPDVSGEGHNPDPPLNDGISALADIV